MVKKTTTVLISAPTEAMKKFKLVAKKQNRTISNFLTNAGLKEVERESCGK